MSAFQANTDPGRVDRRRAGQPSVLLYWLPLGAGGRSVRWNGRVFEALAARYGRRPICDLYHSALEVRIDAQRYVIEMTPAWGNAPEAHGVVREGPVGSRWLGRSVFFRYEVRRWLDGEIPDVGEAVDSPQVLAQDERRARRLLELVPLVPALTWGRDEAALGEMWNSNSLTSWLLASSGHDMTGVGPPRGGRAPGWGAGLALARMDQADRMSLRQSADGSSGRSARSRIF